MTTSRELFPRMASTSHGLEKHKALMVAAVLWLAHLATAPVFAQTAALRGQVLDQTGAVIPGAKITLTGPSGTVSTTTSTRDGSYSFADLEPGDYSLNALAPQLEMAQPVRINLKSGGQTLNLVLRVAAPTEQVTVAASAGPSVSADPSRNATALVLRGPDLQALADNPGPIIGNIESPLFGQANQPYGVGTLGGTGFSESANNRRFELQTRFSL